MTNDGSDREKPGFLAKLRGTLLAAAILFDRVPVEREFVHGSDARPWRFIPARPHPLGDH